MNVKNKKIKVEFKTKDNDSIFVDAIQTYEPERSKREELPEHLVKRLQKRILEESDAR